MDCLQNAKSLTIFEDFVVQAQGLGKLVLKDKDFVVQAQGLGKLVLKDKDFPQRQFDYLLLHVFAFQIILPLSHTSVSKKCLIFSLCILSRGPVL